MEKSIPGILVAALLLTIITCVTAVYFTVNVRNTGTIVAHGCKVYLEDKITESYTVSWGEMRVNQTITNYRWLYNNSTVTANTNMTWHHNAATYLTPKLYYELPNHTWQELQQYQQVSFNQGTWLHIKLELTTLPDAINHQGSFEFTTFIELT